MVYCHDFELFPFRRLRLISCGVSYGSFGQLAVISDCFKPILGSSFSWCSSSTFTDNVPVCLGQLSGFRTNKLIWVLPPSWCSCSLFIRQCPSLVWVSCLRAIFKRQVSYKSVGFLSMFWSSCFTLRPYSKAWHLILQRHRRNFSPSARWISVSG